jgi:cyclitol reductase
MVEVLGKLPLSYRAVELDAGTVALRRREWKPRSDTPWVLLRPMLVGVCGSDYREVRGRRIGQKTFGHEVVATVAGSDGVSLPHLTLVTVDSHVPVHRTSGFGELMILQGSADALRAAVVALPSAVDPTRLVFAEPLACVHHTVQRILAHRGAAAAPPGGTALVVGAGNYGTLIAIVLSQAGLDVTLVNQTPGRLAFLQNNKATRGLRVTTMSGQPQPSFGLVVLATRECTRPLLDLCAAGVRDGGVIVPFAATFPGQRLGGADLHSIRSQEATDVARWGKREASIVGCHGANTGDFTVALERLADPSFPEVEHLVSLRTNLETLPGLLSSDSWAAGSSGKIVVEI